MMNRNVKQWMATAVGLVWGCCLMAQTDSTSVTPTQWDLKSCIDYALKHNISVRKGRLQAQSSDIDVKTAKSELLPTVQGSVGQRMVNRPWSESNTLIDGDQVKTSQSKTSYNGSYGIDLNWTLYQGNKRINNIKQNELNSRIAALNVAESENSIQEQIAQIYVQVLYAAEALKVNQQTLEVSEAECTRAEQLFEAGSIAKSDLAQLQAQVSNDRYNVVTA